MSATTEAGALPASGPASAYASRLPDPDVPPLVVANRGLLLTFVLGGMSMVMLDTTIANVALPHMQASLMTTQDTVTWVLTSYVLASAVALPLSGWLVDTFGVRRILLVSVLLFTIASAMCGAAQNLGQMVGFRVLQGLAGAFLQPIAQTVLLDVSTPRERPKMMAMFTQTIMIAPILGPMLGGYLTENFSWRWCFYVNLPLGIACFIGLMTFMPETPRKVRTFDLMGWLYVTVAVSALQLMLDRGASQDWFESFEIVAYLAISLSAFWMTVVHLLGAKHPLFPLRMFSDTNFVIGVALTFLVGLVLLSTTALMPLLLQSVYGYPVIDAGLLMAPRGIAIFIVMAVMGPHMGRFDPRLLIGLGLGIMSWSLWLMTGWSTVMPTSAIVVAGVIQGLGISLMFVPLNLVVFATLPQDLRTDASSLSSLFRNLGSSIGIACSTVMLSYSIQVNHEEIASRITRMSLPFDLDRITAYGGASQAGMSLLDAMINKEAALIGYLNNFYFMSIACCLAIPLVFLMKRPAVVHAPSPDEAASALGH